MPITPFLIKDIVSLILVVILFVILLIIGFRVNRRPPKHQIYNEWRPNQKNSTLANDLLCPTCQHMNSIDDRYCEQCGTKLQ